MSTTLGISRLDASFSLAMMQIVTGTDRATQSMEQASLSVARLDMQLTQAAAVVQNSGSEMQGLSDEVGEVGEQAEKSESKIKKFIKSIASMDNVKKAFNFGKEAFAESNSQRKAEAQLQLKLVNAGAAEDTFDRIQGKAAEIESKTIYGGDAVAAGGGEFATHTKDGAAIESMMGTLANYAAGKSGGAEVDTKAMTGYAAELSKALEGSYDGLIKEGFILTEEQKKIIATGSDIEKALAIDSVISQSWGGLAETMATLPENRILGITDKLDEMKGMVGNMLTPAIMQFCEIIENNFPLFESIFSAISVALGVVAYILGMVAEAALAVAEFIVGNWSWIAPIILGVAGALALYHGWQLAANAAGLISSGVQAAMTAAQLGLNAAMAACPALFIIGVFIILIGLIYAGVAAVNKFTGANISATGLIAAVIGSFVTNFMNYFIMIWNVVVEFINFFANVWKNPIASVQILFLNLASNVIGYILEIAGAIETIINRISPKKFNFTAGLEDIKGKLEKMSADIKDASEWEEVVARKEFISGEDSANSWYDQGNDIESKIGAGFDGLFDSSSYDLDLSGLGLKNNPATDGLSGIGGSGLGSGGNPMTVKGTGAGGAVTVESEEEDIEWMRKLAERDYVARIAQNTLAPNIRVDFSGPITKEADVNAVAARMGEILKEQIATAPEGVYA